MCSCAHQQRVCRLKTHTHYTPLHPEPSIATHPPFPPTTSKRAYDCNVGVLDRVDQPLRDEAAKVGKDALGLKEAVSEVVVGQLRLRELHHVVQHLKLGLDKGGQLRRRWSQGEKRGGGA